MLFMYFQLLPSGRQAKTDDHRKIYRKRQKSKKSYRITSGNIGFGAYSDDYSFFMDGGKESRARSKDAVIENVSSYAKAVAQLNPDFMLFQEVDIDGTRSYHVMNANHCFHRHFQPITPHETTHLLRTMTALICSIRFWSHMERTNPVCLQFLIWRSRNPSDALYRSRMDL